VCGPLRPCTWPVHSPFTAVYTAVYDGRPTRAYIYIAVKRPCAHHVHVRVHTSTQSCTWQVGLHGRVNLPRRHVTAVGHAHGCNAPCTRSCTRPIHSHIHVRLHGPCTRPRTRTVCRVTAEYTGRYMAVYALCRRPKTAVYTASVHGRKRPCTWPVHCRVH